MKNLKKILESFFVLFLLFLISCKQQIDFFVTDDKRKSELEKIAVLGDFKLEDYEIENELIEILKNIESEKSRSAISREWSISKIAEENIRIPYESKFRTVRAETDDINYLLYETTFGEQQGYAICSDDRRVGTVLAIVDGEFENDISEDPFMQMFAERLESWTSETVNSWKEIENEHLERSAVVNKVISGNYTYSNWFKKSGNLNNIMSTLWGQGNEYYSSHWYSDAIASVYKKNYVTGCVTTAVAQILAYNKGYNKCPEKTLSVIKSNWDYANVNAATWNGMYDWELMTARSDIANLSALGKVMVSTLMYDVAEGIKANYGTVEDGGNWCVC